MIGTQRVIPKRIPNTFFFMDQPSTQVIFPGCAAGVVVHTGTVANPAVSAVGIIAKTDIISTGSLRAGLNKTICVKFDMKHIFIFEYGNKRIKVPNSHESC